MARLPAYERIRQDIASQIDMGIYQSSARIPSEVVLAEQYGVTRMTVRQAVAGLVSDGLLIRRHGSGTYVAERPHLRSHTKLTSFVEELRAAGKRVTTRVISQGAIVPSPEVAGELMIGADTLVTEIARVRLVDEKPAAYQFSWIPYGRCPGLAREELIDGSLYSTLEQRYGVVLVRADERIAAVSASADQARHLDVRVRSPLLQIRRRTFDEHNVPVEFASSVMRKEYSLATTVER